MQGTERFRTRRTLPSGTETVTCVTSRTDPSPGPRASSLGRDFKITGGLGIALLPSVLVGIVLAVAPAAPAARTLVVTPTPIDAFAQDGPYLAWTARAPNSMISRCGRIYIRSLVTGRQRSLGARTAPACPGFLALGRKRALWTGDPGFCGNCVPARVLTASLDDPRVVSLGTFSHLAGGTQLTGFAADWRLHVFSWVRYEFVEEPGSCLFEPVPCKWDVTGGRAVQVLGRERRQVPGVASPALLAAGGGRIAVAKTDDPWQGPEDPQPAENGAVEVLAPRTGALVMSVSPTGSAYALALSRGALALLLKRTDGSYVIERYTVPAGTLLASTTVSARAAFGRLDIAHKWIVYSAGRQIRIVGPLGGDRLLLRAPTFPIGVSIEGRRVAWAENNRGRHRIRAILAPR
jgi:hypothetical protein